MNSALAPQLSIILPMYNEGRIVEATLGALADYLDESGRRPSTQVVCAVTGDAGDRSLDIITALRPRFAQLRALDLGRRIGKGRTVRAGMLAATGRVRLFMDADLATPLHHIDRAVAAIEAGADVAVGVRDLLAMHDTAGRTALSVASHALVDMLVRTNLPDTQCGFKAFTAPAALRLFSRQQVMGWGFDFELIAMARRMGLQIASVPVPDWSDPRVESGLAGDSAVKVISSTLRELLRVRLSLWRRQYD